MSVLDTLATFLVVLPAVLYVPAAYYFYELALGKGVRRFFLLLGTVILLFVRRIYIIWQYSRGFPADIIDDLLADLVAISLLMAAREMNKSLTEIFRPILQSRDQDKLVS